MNRFQHPTQHQHELNLLSMLQIIFFGGLILYFGSSLFIPLAFALLISFILYPLCIWLEQRGAGRGLAIAVCITGLTLVLLGLSALMASQFVAFLNEWPAFQGKVIDAAYIFTRWLSTACGISPEQQSQWFMKAMDHAFLGALSFLQNAVTVSAFSAVMLILIPVYSILILYYRHTWAEVLCKIFYRERKETIREGLILTIRTYYDFIKGMGIVYLAVGILNSLGLLLLGVPHAILFGFIASILTFIPYVGILVGALLPITVSWVTYDSLAYPLGVIAVFTFVQYLEANVIFPFAVGSRLNVNTLFVLVAIFLGGILWGVAGMILFVPFTGIVKLIADHYNLSTLSLLLGTQNKK